MFCLYDLSIVKSMICHGMTDKQTDWLTDGHKHIDWRTDDKTTNEEDDEIVVADVVVVAAVVVANVVVVFVVVEIVVVENFLQCMLIVEMAPELPGRPFVCSLVGG